MRFTSCSGRRWSSSRNCRAHWTATLFWKKARRADTPDPRLPETPYPGRDGARLGSGDNDRADRVAAPGDLRSHLRAQLNRRYVELLRAQARTVQQLQEACWLLRNAGQRLATIERVANTVLCRQATFFVHGDAALRPLQLREFALELDLRESTVSRATANRYMATPAGLYELKFFFSRELPTRARAKLAGGGACGHPRDHLRRECRRAAVGRQCRAAAPPAGHSRRRAHGVQVPRHDASAVRRVAPHATGPPPALICASLRAGSAAGPRATPAQRPATKKRTAVRLCISRVRTRPQGF